MTEHHPYPEGPEVTPSEQHTRTDEIEAAPLTPEEEARRAEQEEVGEFLIFLSTQYRRGLFALELARAMKALTVAVRRHGKRGSVTVKFTVEPVRNAPTGSVQVDAELTSKVPRGERPKAVMFSKEDGSLTLDHPDQMSMYDVPGRAIGSNR